MYDPHWMKQALDLALEAEKNGDVPVGAVLVSDDRLIGKGYNQKEIAQRVIAHAEILALEDYHARFSQWRLPQGTALYVTAEPCIMCTGALMSARIDYIYYGCPDPKRAALSSLLPL